MANSYYTPTGIVTQTKARSSLENSDRAAVEVGFDRLPTKASMDAGSVWFVEDTGAADVYVVAMQKTASSYTDGMSFTMKVANTNTGACTVNVDSLGAKAIKLANGTDPIAGDMIVGDFVDMRYDADAGYFRITSVTQSIINGQASMSDAAIKTAYENNADTNAFTDAEKAKLAFITATQAVNLDELGALSKTGSGSGSTGDPLAMNSDGTVSVIAANDGTAVTGTEVTFTHPTERAVRSGRNLVKISEGKVLWVGGDDDNVADSGVARVITFDPDDVTATITVGAAVEYEASFAGAVAACLVSENKVLAVYVDNDNSHYATAVVIRVDGLVPVPGTPVVFKSAAIDYDAQRLDCCAIGEDRAVVFSSATGATELFACTISGLTPSFGSGVSIDSNAALNAALCSFGPDQFFVAYADTGDSNYLNGVIGSVSGTTVALKTPARIYANTAISYVSANFVAEKDGKPHIIACSDGYANLLSLDGSGFSVLDSIAIQKPNSVDVLGDTFCLFDINYNSLAYIYIYDVDLEAETITSVDAIAIGSSPVSYYGGIAAVGDRLFMAQWEKTSLGRINLAAVRRGDRSKFCGFAAADFADTEDVTVKPIGTEATGLTGLTAGVHYWLDWDGSLVTEETDVYAGIATSATSILVGGGRKG